MEQTLSPELWLAERLQTPPEELLSDLEVETFWVRAMKSIVPSEQLDEVLGIPDRFTDEPVPLQVVMPDGSLKDVKMYRHYNRTVGHGYFSDLFDKMMQAFYGLGAARAVKFGDADCILCDAKGIFEVCEKLFAIEENCVIDRAEIPEEWWK